MRIRFSGCYLIRQESIHVAGFDSQTAQKNFQLTSPWLAGMALNTALSQPTTDANATALRRKMEQLDPDYQPGAFTKTFCMDERPSLQTQVHRPFYFLTGEDARDDNKPMPTLANTPDLHLKIRVGLRGYTITDISLNPFTTP